MAHPFLYYSRIIEKIVFLAFFWSMLFLLLVSKFFSKKQVYVYSNAAHEDLINFSWIRIEWTAKKYVNFQ